MISEKELEDLKKLIEEFLSKMTIGDCLVAVSKEESDAKPEGEVYDVMAVSLSSKEPQFIIGRDGQNLLDLQKVLRLLISKKIGKNLYLKLDINDYQRQKIEYLRNLANTAAHEVVLTKKEKPLPCMSAYDRRIIHEELSDRQDIVVESQGEGEQRHIVVSAKLP